MGLTLGATVGSTGSLGLTLDYGGSENNGNLLSQQIVGSGLAQTLVQSYRYDSSNRLSKAAGTLGTAAGTEVWHRTFGADDYGNGYTSEWSASLAPNSFTPTTASWFNGKNQLVNAALPAVPDPNGTGNLTTIGGYQMTYDGENRLATSTMSAVTTTYAYDGEGRRVKRGAVTYVYDAFGELAAEYGGTATASGTQYLTADWLGSTRAVRAGGTVTERRDYLPCGEVIPAALGGRTALWGASVGVRQEFAGKERDSETEFEYFEARYLDGRQMRFTSADPISMTATRLGDPQRFNLYAYALNNPFRFGDPTGMDPGNPVAVPCKDPGSGNCFTTLPQKDGEQKYLEWLALRTEPQATQDFGQKFIVEMDRRSEPSKQLVGAVGVGAVAVGATAALAPVAGQAINELAFGSATGRLYWAGGQVAAEAAAASGAGRVISQSPVGGAFARLTSFLSYSLQRPGWAVLSRFWASGAAGTVNVFPRSPHPNSLLMQVELPVLLRNQNVFKPLQYR